MISSTFETRRFLKTYSIQLQKNGVHIIKKTPFESLEFDISYEQIETKKIVETKISFGLLTVTLLFAVTGILYFLGDGTGVSNVFFLFGLFVLCIAFITKLRVVTIRSYDGQNIELYFTKRNKEEVITFADTIISSANGYLLNKFSKIDRDLPVDNQLANLDFLRNKGLITDEEFNELKNQLLGRSDKRSIGYR